MTTIRLMPNGPAVINDPMDGIITIISEDGATQTTTEGKVVAICRCGKSENKPYCDGSHKPKPIEE